MLRAEAGGYARAASRAGPGSYGVGGFARREMAAATYDGMR